MPQDCVNLSNSAASEDYMGTFEITESNERYHGTYLEIKIKGISSLPAALQRLAQLGYDMRSAQEVLRQAVVEQHKRKALDAAVAEMLSPDR